MLQQDQRDHDAVVQGSIPIATDKVDIAHLPFMKQIQAEHAVHKQAMMQRLRQRKAAERSRQIAIAARYNAAHEQSHLQATGAATSPQPDMLASASYMSVRSCLGADAADTSMTCWHPATVLIAPAAMFLDAQVRVATILQNCVLKTGQTLSLPRSVSATRSRYSTLSSLPFLPC